MRALFHLVITLLIGYSAWTGFQFYTFYQNTNIQQYDYAEINEIKYGLFNLELWKEKLFSILDKKAGSFELRQSDYDAVQVVIEKYLVDLHKEYFESGKLLESLTKSQKEENKLGAMFLQMFKGNIEEQIEKMDFKSKIPLISAELIKELRRKSPEIKKAITDQISLLLADEAGAKMIDRRTRIYKKYDLNTYDELDVYLEGELAKVESTSADLTRKSIGALALALLLLILARSTITFRNSMLWLGAISTVFLLIGLALPMIDLDARLSSVDLEIMGEKIQFDEQFIYYQSKSILDVTRTLLESRGIDTKIVGILILVFSIILPLSKMILTALYLFYEKAKKQKWIKIIIFYMGKWSMADVFVVAIFMSFIGINALVDTQLINVNQVGSSATLETMNYTKLSPGIIFFTIYVVLTIIMSSLIHRKVEQQKT